MESDQERVAISVERGYAPPDHITTREESDSGGASEHEGGDEEGLEEWNGEEVSVKEEQRDEGQQAHFTIGLSAYVGISCFHPGHDW